MRDQDDLRSAMERIPATIVGCALCVGALAVAWFALLHDVVMGPR